MPQHPRITCNTGHATGSSADSGRKPADLTHHFNASTRARKPSVMKGLYKYFMVPGMSNIAGGLSIQSNPIARRAAESERDTDPIVSQVFRTPASSPTTPCVPMSRHPSVSSTSPSTGSRPLRRAPASSRAADAKRTQRRLTFRSRNSSRRSLPRSASTSPRRCSTGAPRACPRSRTLCASSRSPT